ncbi:phospholipid/cholesterol/gamma-HCH transport system substrate-binding protein [Rhodococcoides kroppenstedtii]|uniref:Phospholipid/cholesterol/gamma-HCH transport system substrate-binding protein n=1 Tax=Rhodococcoides kroppenstedtii TaxID=293050 RepID=A0A1I0UBZ6_9NOCA|nr:MlaD family protein [Rhodococcus kroppenstedtii]SFA61555.1 phospholipid/cholesterol/gamma-HCH transport system substrate-binding protein [Rhodococcus kroppenstedtii]
MTPEVRRRLGAFAVVAVLALSLTAVLHARLPETLGVGRYQVTVELSAGAGLSSSSNVTYRGAPVGRVVSVRPTPFGAEAVLSLVSDTPVPATTRAEVHSMSAVGEQYVDLVPDTDRGPFLADGDAIERERTSVPAPVAPTVDALDAALRSIDPVTLSSLLDETAAALGTSGDPTGELLDSAAALAGAARENVNASSSLITDIAPVLSAAAASSPAIREWAASLASLTGEVADRDAAVRSLLDAAPGLSAASDELFRSLEPTLPILLADLTGVGQVAVTYNAPLEQILVLYPPLIAATQGTGKANADAGDPGQNTFFAAQLNDPPPCTEGFLPADQRRPPTALDTPETPTDLWCRAPATGPTSIRGARNLPCMEFPGRRAATVALCRAGQGDLDTAGAPPAGVSEMLVPPER